MTRLRPVLATYVLAGVMIWPVPLLQILHVESSALIAVVAFFAAGLNSFRWMSAGERPGRVLRAQLGALAVPWLLGTVTLLWAPNCGYAQGLLFFALFPVVSVVFAVMLAFASSTTRHPQLIFCLVGIGIILFGPLYDVGFHPQFYTYNHVFGGILGPIYDEELAIRPGLFVFRAMTLLWAAMFYLIGLGRQRDRQGRPKHISEEPSRCKARRRSSILTTAVALSIGLCYLFAGPLGINTPAPFLQRALGGVYHTTHFDLYFDPTSLKAGALRRLAADHEYEYARLASRLGVEVPGRIASYLYPDAETKAQLTGSRFTNVAPVWLARPQVHVLLSTYSQVFPHELAHVFSRSFGLPVIRASLSVGLVEGFAVAMEPPDGLPSPHAQVLSAALHRLHGRVDRLDLAPGLSSRLSPLGFWTGRGAVSYTTMGSFVRFLIDRYGAAEFERVYAQGNFETIYGKSPHELAEEWETFLLGMPVISRASGPLATRRFAVPSLFETRCPHYIPQFIRKYRDGVRAYAAGDTMRAIHAWDAALSLNPSHAPTLEAWARAKLAKDLPEEVVSRLDTLVVDIHSASLELRLGDAFALLRKPFFARRHYEAAYRGLPLYANEMKAWLVIRNALASSPNIVRILVSGDSVSAQAARLDSASAPAARLAAAFRWLSAREPGLAAARFAAIPTMLTNYPGREALIARQRNVWTARSLYRAGNIGGAIASAKNAERTFRDVGDFDAAARMTEMASELTWIRATYK